MQDFKLLEKKEALQMFYEEGNALSTFVRLDLDPTNAECKYYLYSLPECFFNLRINKTLMSNMSLLYLCFSKYTFFN